MHPTTIPRDLPRDAQGSPLEQDGFRWAYLLLSFGLLASVAYRGFVRQESSWDLLALVVLGGLVSAWYRWRHGALSPGWALVSVAALVAALILGALLAMVVR